MTSKPQPGSGVNGALWLIAFSLLTIAVCMVFMLIDKHFPAPKDETRSEAIPENLTALPRPERHQSHHSGSLRTADTFADLAAPQATEVAHGATEASSDSSQGFFPTAMAPPPGRYLPAIPRIIGQPAFRSGVKGRVILQGTPPPERQVQVPPEYPCAIPDPPVFRSHYFTGTNGGLANTVVYIASSFNQPVLISDTTNELVLSDCRIEPSFNVFVRGQPLRIRDNMGLAHSFDGLGFATNRPAPIEISPEGSASVRTLVYSTNPIPLTCKLHPWEMADVWFISPALFAVTHPDGTFNITNVPPGTYIVEAAHWSGSIVQKTSKKIVVHPDQTTSVNFVIQAPTTETAAQF